MFGLVKDAHCSCVRTYTSDSGYLMAQKEVEKLRMRSIMHASVKYRYNKHEH
jgi:hypothetical protein